MAFVLFKKKQQRLFLQTSLKVMSETLRQQNNLKTIFVRYRRDGTIYNREKNKHGLGKLKNSWGKVDRWKCRKRLLYSWFVPGAKFYMVVRNPYSRIESFYKDKFCNYLDPKKNLSFGSLCWSVRPFMPFLGIDTTASEVKIMERLRRVSFDECVSMLPYVYKLEIHLYPQYWGIESRFRFCFVPVNLSIKLEKIFKLESDSDMKELKQLFDLDEKKTHSSKKYNDQIIWTNKGRKIVEAIYREDFKRFKYDMKGGE